MSALPMRCFLTASLSLSDRIIASRDGDSKFGDSRTALLYIPTSVRVPCCLFGKSTCSSIIPSYHVLAWAASQLAISLSISHTISRLSLVTRRASSMTTPGTARLGFSVGAAEPLTFLEGASPLVLLPLEKLLEEASRTSSSTRCSRAG